MLCCAELWGCRLNTWDVNFSCSVTPLAARAVTFLGCRRTLMWCSSFKSRDHLIILNLSAMHHLKNVAHTGQHFLEFANLSKCKTKIVVESYSNLHCPLQKCRNQSPSQFLGTLLITSLNFLGKKLTLGQIKTFEIVEFWLLNKMISVNCWNCSDWGHFTKLFLQRQFAPINNRFRP